MENTPPQPQQPQPPHGVEHTQPLPPYDPAGQPTTQHWPAQSRAPRRSRGLVAGVLAGALVLGGAAGIGGAALYDVVTDEPSASSTSSTDGGTFAPSDDVPVASGSVEKVAQEVLPSVVKVNVTGPQGAGSGSGIVLSKDGKILTNNHVVTGAGDGAQITVTFNDGTTKRATVTGTDPITDVAVLDAQGVSDLTPAKLGQSSDLRVGQTVVAVGAPFGLESTVTAGIVSALNRPVSVSTQEPEQSPFGEAEPQDLSTTYPAIQTDAAINPGNSGGPLVDMSGRVVGINSSIRTSSTDLTGGQGGSIGLGFAIPIDEVLPIVNQIVDGETPTHARLGVTVSDVSSNGLTRGARIRSVEDGAAAAEAGLRSGDVVTKVDDQVIDSSESLVATIRGHRPGDRVKITYVRGGETKSVTAELGSDQSTRSS